MGRFVETQDDVEGDSGSWRRSQSFAVAWQYGAGRGAKRREASHAEFVNIERPGNR